MRTCRSALLILVALVTTVWVCAETPTPVPAPPKPCVFCEIAAGRLEPELVVYRDELVLAFMDIAPGNPGHVLVVPAQHADDIVAVPAATAQRMIVVAQCIARAIRRTELRAEGFNFILNTGRAAGQTVFHAHLHVVPRYSGDSGGHGDKPRRRLMIEELAPMAAKIRAAVGDELLVAPVAR